MDEAANLLLEYYAGGWRPAADESGLKSTTMPDGQRYVDWLKPSRTEDLPKKPEEARNGYQLRQRGSGEDRQGQVIEWIVGLCSQHARRGAVGLDDDSHLARGGGVGVEETLALWPSTLRLAALLAPCLAPLHWTGESSQASQRPGLMLAGGGEPFP